MHFPIVCVNNKVPVCPKGDKGGPLMLCTQYPRHTVQSAQTFKSYGVCTFKLLRPNPSFKPLRPNPPFKLLRPNPFLAKRYNMCIFRRGKEGLYVTLDSRLILYDSLPIVSEACRRTTATRNCAGRGLSSSTFCDSSTNR